MLENQQPASTDAPATTQETGGFLDGDMGEMMSAALAKHMAGGGEPAPMDAQPAAPAEPAPEPQAVAPDPVATEPPKTGNTSALEAQVSTLTALVQTLLTQRQAPAEPAPAVQQPPAKAEPEDPFERSMLAGLRKELGTEDVPTEIVEKYKRAVALRSLANTPGWDTPEVKAAITAAEKDARSALDGYRQHGGLAARIAELEKELKASRAQAGKPQEQAAWLAAAEQEFSTPEKYPEDYPALRKVAQSGAGKHLARAAAQVFAEKHGYGSIPPQEFAQWLRAVEQQVAPIAKLAEEQPGQRAFILTTLRSANPALAEVMAPMLGGSAPAPAAPAKTRTVTPPTIPQSSGGGIPRPATKDLPLHQMEPTEFDDFLMRKAREHGV